MIRKKKMLSKALVAVMLLSLTASAGGTAVEAAAKKKPKLSSSKITMETGQKKTLKLKNYTNLSKKKIKKVKWTTSNKKVATVKASGKYKQNAEITAQASGSATVKLKYDGKTYKCKVTVPAVSGTSTEKSTPATTATEKNTQTATTEKPLTNDSKTECSHKWNDGAVTKAATCKEEGEKIYICTLCNKAKTESIPKIAEHKWDDGVITKEATCKEDGIKTYTCLICGETESEVIPKITTHTWDKGEETKKATCKEKGVLTYTCTVCGETKQVDSPVNPKNHEFNDNHECRLCGKMDEENALVYKLGTNSSNYVLGCAYAEQGKNVLYIKQFGTGIKGQTSFAHFLPECESYLGIKINSIKFINNVYAGNSLTEAFKGAELVSIDGLGLLDTLGINDWSNIFCLDSKLQSVDFSTAVLPNGANINMMFYGCSSLKEVYLPDNYRGAHDWGYTFAGCGDAVKIYVSNTLDRAFIIDHAGDMNCPKSWYDSGYSNILVAN